MGDRKSLARRGAGVRATWSVQQMNSRSGAGVGEDVETVGFHHPPRPHAPHSLTRVSAAAGRVAGRGAASPSKGSPGRGAEVTLPSFPGVARPGRCVLFFVEGRGASRRGYGL